MPVDPFHFSFPYLFVFELQSYKKSSNYDSIIVEKFILHIYLHAVQHENLALPCLANFVAIQQLEFPCPFVVVVLDADASLPLLDFPFGSPKSDIYWLRSVKDEPCR